MGQLRTSPLLFVLQALIPCCVVHYAPFTAEYIGLNGFLPAHTILKRFCVQVLL